MVGHVWCYQPGGTELMLYRLSDGRPFAHRLGSPIEAVASHPAAPHTTVAIAGEAGIPANTRVAITNLRRELMRSISAHGAKGQSQSV